MLRGFLRDKRAASAVEFALIAPFLLLLVAAILAYGSIFATSLSLQQIAAETARATIGGLSAALLDATLGYQGKLTVMDYNSLASANIDVGEFLRALNVKANINAVTFDQVLSASGRFSMRRSRQPPPAAYRPC